MKFFSFIKQIRTRFVPTVDNLPVCLLNIFCYEANGCKVAAMFQRGASAVFACDVGSVSLMESFQCHQPV